MSNALAVKQDTSLTKVEPRSVVPHARLPLPTAAEIQALQQYAAIVMKSGIAPAHFKNPEAVLVVMRYGHQLGIDEFTALQNMFVIGGKPTMMASLMHGLILRDHGPNAIQIKQQDAHACVLICRPKGAEVGTEVSFTMAEATNAGLPSKNQNWKTYPSDMLFSRAVSRAARRVFRDTTLGMYTPEELDANVVEVDGEVVVGQFEPTIVETTHSAPQIASTTTESDVEESWDLRLSDAQDEKDKAKQKAAFRTLLAEVVAEEDEKKARQLVSALPTYAEAEATRSHLFDKYNFPVAEMNKALRDRDDAPEFVDTATGEIVDG